MTSVTSSSASSVIQRPFSVLQALHFSETRFVAVCCATFMVVETGRGVYYFKRHWERYLRSRRQYRRQREAVTTDLVESSSEEEEEEKEEEDPRPTPEMLIQYWQQLERAILMAPRPNAPSVSRALPESCVGLLPIHHVDPKHEFLKKNRETQTLCRRTVLDFSNRLELPVQGCFIYREKPRLVQLGAWAVSGGGDSDSDEPRLKWEALLLSWTGTVDAVVSTREIRKLILAAAPPFFRTHAVTCEGSNGPTLFDTSSTSLALLWYLGNIRAIYQALIVDKDVHRCEEDLEELDAYARPIFDRCIWRWPNTEEMISVSEYALSTGLVKVMASAVGCWSTLTAVRLELQQVQRQMRIKSLYSLGRYLYASSKSKYISAALIAVLTAANTYINSLGRGFKTTVEHYLENRPVQEGRDNALKSSCWTVVLLVLAEFGRLGLSYVMTRTTNEFINLSAGQRRQAVTAQLFEALSHTPLSYFDKHTYDDVEEIMYYVDDMEGVDVQVHQFLFNTVSTFALLRSTFREVHGRVLLLAVIAAVAPRLLNRLAGLVEQYYGVLQREGYLSWIGQGKEMDKKDEEDGFARDGMWLRGLEIVGAIHQLRPYGADVRLVHWWNQQSQHKRDESFDGADYIMGAFRALFSLPWGQSVAALGYASLQTAEWLLPITITTVVARRWKIHNVVSVTYASSVIESALSVVTDGNDLMEMILHNAYKTSVLEHVLRPERFEESTLAERKHWHNYVTARMTCFTASGVQVPDCCVSGSSLLDGKFHRSHVLHKVTLHRVQFRYPTMMDVAVFPKPFSAEIVLQDANGVGRMVCLTGPPSCGKTTLAHLLLSLYMVEESEEGEEGDAPPITFTFHGGPDVRLYKSGGSVCSLSRRGVSHSSSPVSRTAPTVDEVDLKRIPVDLLRSHVFSYVPQESILFDGASIAQNVSLNGYVSLASVQTVRQVERCMAATGCKFVEQFPQGVLTRITSSSMSRTLGAGGAADRRAYQRLSADQADRLMMARALYHGADILLLDDPVAHLDEEATLGFITLWRSLLQSGRLHGVLCFTNSPTLLNAADEVITIA